MTQLEKALQLIGQRFWIIPLRWTINGVCTCGRREACPSPGKHPLTALVRHGEKDATNDPTVVERWWGRYPRANIGICTKPSGLVVIDVDGPEGLDHLRELAGGAPPLTLTARTGRAGGFHLYYAGTGVPSGQKPGEALDVRGGSGYVVAPGSFHCSGREYQWANPEQRPTPVPMWVEPWARGRLLAGKAGPPASNGLDLGPVPAYAKGSDRVEKALANVGRSDAWSPYNEARLYGALAAIEPDIDGRTWVSIGNALFDLEWFEGDTDIGFELWDAWSKESKGEGAGNGQYRGRENLERRWKSFEGKEISGLPFTIASIFKLASERGWLGELKERAKKVNGHHALPPIFDQEPESNILVALNKKHAVIEDIGGKCLVLSWVNSKVDESVKVPSFQTFKSFSERYANRYIAVKNKKDEDEAKQVGAYWLKWTKRRSFEGIDLVPGGPELLPGGYLNLWSGFAFAPVAGDWHLMRRHIREVLAAGDDEAALYIVKFAAWAVQNPDKRAEVALVFRGGKGSGKGTFANALKRMFGQHGLQIYNSKHLVGNFNSHLRNCILLYADEAFWAGDKAGESVLKGMLTEPTLVIEQKGVDAAAWKNRLHVIMTANAEWVVPASHDERRFAMFDVSDARCEDRAYFSALYQEIEAGGSAAMLHDLLHLDLNGWHPRQIVKNVSLQLQKVKTMPLIWEWWEDLLQRGVAPYYDKKKVDVATAATLLDNAHNYSYKLRDLTATALGRFLIERGSERVHKNTGNEYKFNKLTELRSEFVKYWGTWEWHVDIQKWADRDEKLSPVINTTRPTH